MIFYSVLSKQRTHTGVHRSSNVLCNTRDILTNRSHGHSITFACNLYNAFLDLINTIMIIGSDCDVNETSKCFIRGEKRDRK